MDGDTLVLATTEEDWYYAWDLTEALSQIRKHIFRVEYDIPELAGPKLFQWLDDLTDGRASCEVMLLLPRQFVANQANSTDYATERYIFRISVDNSDTFASPPWILCIRQPEPYKPKPTARASSRSPADSPDRYEKNRRSKGNSGGGPDKFNNRPNRQSKIRPYVKILVREFEEGIGLGGINPAAYSDLGFGLWCLEKYDAAYQVYEKAIQCNSDNAAAFNGLGNASWCLERYGRAIQAYEKATGLTQSGESI